MTQGSVFFSSPTQQDGIEASPYGAEWNTGIGIIDSPVFRYRYIQATILRFFNSSAWYLFNIKPSQNKRQARDIKNQCCMERTDPIPLRFLELDTEKSGGGTEVHREEIFFFLRGVCLGLK